MESLMDRLWASTVRWDGGMGTALLGLGLPVERWNRERPDAVREVHRAFVEAGAEVVQTNTFGSAETADVAVRLARSVDAFVVGSLGPKARGARLLERAGVDALHLETLSGREEALEGLRRARCGVPIICSLTLRPEGDRYVTLSGEDPFPVYRSLRDAGADAVGANCMLDADEMAHAMGEFRSGIDLPFVARPQAIDREGYARLVRAGADGIGGCCGVTAGMLAAAWR